MEYAMMMALPSALCSTALPARASTGTSFASITRMVCTLAHSQSLIRRGDRRNGLRSPSVSFKRSFLSSSQRIISRFAGAVGGAVQRSIMHQHDLQLFGKTRVYFSVAAGNGKGCSRMLRCSSPGKPLRGPPQCVRSQKGRRSGVYLKKSFSSCALPVLIVCSFAGS